MEVQSADAQTTLFLANAFDISVSRNRHLLLCDLQMKKSPLKRTSKKRAKQMRIYFKDRRAFLSEKFCEFPEQPFGCHNRATDIHHGNGRNGERLLDAKHWWAICRVHHAWLHSHPREARAMGLLK